jgi:hypothetical protein
MLGGNHHEAESCLIFQGKIIMMVVQGCKFTIYTGTADSQAQFD